MSTYETHIPMSGDMQYNEKTTGGTILPFAKYHAETSEMLPFYPIHWHEEVEIIKVSRGRGRFCVDGTWYTADAGNVIILRPFAMHSINRVEGWDMSIDAIVFNLRLLGSDGTDSTLKYFAPLLNEKRSVPCVVRTTDSWYTQFDQCLTALFSCDPSREGAEPDVKTNLYWMFYYIYANRLTNVKPNVAEDKRIFTVRLALEYVRTHYAENVAVQDVANHCGYSEFYLMKLFKQFTGCSCVDYVNNYRLTVAGRQLRDSDDDVAAVARRVGFNNVSYFNRQFKKQYGMTPKEFRKQFAN